MKTSFVALTVAAAVGLSSVPAFARDHGGQRHEIRHDGHWNGGVYVQPGYAPHAAYHPRGAYYPQSYHYRHRRDSGDVVGAAIAGALLGGLMTQLATPNR